MLSNREQNVKNSENHGEQQQQKQQEEEEKQEEGEVAEEVKLESLPEEVLDMIVNLSMTGHNRIIVDTYNALSHTSTKFRGSGLVVALKETIASLQWINAWINLLFTGVVTWMYVTATFWRKGKK